MKLKSSPPWFGSIVSISRQRRGLEVIAVNCLDHHILDLGSAEGDISDWLIDIGGASSADCVDYAPERIQSGNSTDRGHDMRFFLHNLNEPLPTLRRESYDTVLMLAILQKLNNPLAFLDSVLPLCSNFLAIRTPQDSIANRPIETYLKSRGFYCIQETDGYPIYPTTINPRGEAWLGVFQNVRQ